MLPDMVTPKSASQKNSNAPNDSAAPDTTTSTSSNDTLKWAPCTDPNAQDKSLECATLKVPLDYDKPTGDSIDMALIKFPATGDRKGAVLFNPGGPGGSGFDPIAFSGNAIASGLGIDSFDLIGFDPRGVDRSGGIHCVSDQFQDQHIYADDTPDTPEEQALKDEALTTENAGLTEWPVVLIGAVAVSTLNDIHTAELQFRADRHDEPGGAGDRQLRPRREHRGNRDGHGAGSGSGAELPAPLRPDGRAGAEWQRPERDGYDVIDLTP